MRDRKVNQLNSCFLNNTFALQTGKLYFCAMGRAFMHYIKPLDFCVKGKTSSASLPWLLAQHPAPEQVLVTGWARTWPGREAGEFAY